MNKTIKIIDLLNKIANGEEVPKKILYKEKIFEFDELEKCFITSNFDNSVINDLTIYLDDGLNQNSLNDVVEILEDNTEEIEETNLYYVTCESDFKNMNIVKLLNEFFEKNDLIVNELVRAVNQIRKEKE